LTFTGTARKHFSTVEAGTNKNATSRGETKLLHETPRSTQASLLQHCGDAVAIPAFAENWRD